MNRNRKIERGIVLRHFKNKPRIEDILEEHVDEKYYLPQKHIDRMTFKEQSSR